MHRVCDAVPFSISFSTGTYLTTQLICCIAPFTVYAHCAQHWQWLRAMLPPYLTSNDHLCCNMWFSQWRAGLVSADIILPLSAYVATRNTHSNVQVSFPLRSHFHWAPTLQHTMRTTMCRNPFHWDYTFFWVLMLQRAMRTTACRITSVEHHV